MVTSATGSFSFAHVFDSASYGLHFSRANFTEYSPSLTVSGSNVTGVYTINADVLPAPTNLSASVLSDTEISLTWNAVTDAAGGYDILQNGTRIATATANTYTVTGLRPYTTYSFTVKAVNYDNEPSAASTAASATTKQSAPIQVNFESFTDMAQGSPVSVKKGASKTFTVAASYTSPVWYQNGSVVNSGAYSYTFDATAAMIAGTVYEVTVTVLRGGELLSARYRVTVTNY
jgi:chitinase